jgi:hypothetical protein
MNMNECVSREHEALKERRRLLAEKLKPLGVVRVEVDYDGCGDSGDIQEVRALKKGPRSGKEEPANLDGQSVTVERFESVYNAEKKEWDRKPYQATATLKEALSDFALDFLSFLGIDWYNNEGGYGTIVLDMVAGEAKEEHNYRIESSEYEEHAL